MATTAYQMTHPSQIDHGPQYYAHRNAVTFPSLGASEKAWTDHALDDPRMAGLSDYDYDKACERAARGDSLQSVIAFAVLRLDNPGNAYQSEAFRSHPKCGKLATAERCAYRQRRAKVYAFRLLVSRLKTELKRMERRETAVTRLLKNHVTKYGPHNLPVLRQTYQDELHGLAQRIADTKGAMQQAVSQIDEITKGSV